VALKINFEKVKTQIKRMDPEGSATIKERNNSEETKNGAAIGGAAGAANNDPNGNPNVQRTGDNSEGTRNEIETLYEPSVTNILQTDRGPVIEQISIAVTVDGRYEQVKEAKEGEESEEEYVPLSVKELKDIRELVSAAIGLNEKRGDVLKVHNIKFHQGEELEGLSLKESERNALLMKGIRYAAVLLGFLILAFVGMRPIMRFLSAEPETAEILEEGLALPPGEEPLALPGEELASLEEEEQTLIDRIRAMAQENPDVATAILQHWLKEVES